MIKTESILLKEFPFPRCFPPTRLQGFPMCAALFPTCAAKANNATHSPELSTRLARLASNPLVQRLARTEASSVDLGKAMLPRPTTVPLALVGVRACPATSGWWTVALAYPISGGGFAELTKEIAQGWELSR